jgi:hypothetical protein
MAHRLARVAGDHGYLVLAGLAQFPRDLPAASGRSARYQPLAVEVLRGQLLVDPGSRRDRADPGPGIAALAELGHVGLGGHPGRGDPDDRRGAAGAPRGRGDRGAVSRSRLGRCGSPWRGHSGAPPSQRCGGGRPYRVGQPLMHRAARHPSDAAAFSECTPDSTRPPPATATPQAYCHPACGRRSRTHHCAANIDQTQRTYDRVGLDSRRRGDSVATCAHPQRIVGCTIVRFRHVIPVGGFGCHSRERSGGRWARPPRMASMVMPSLAA